jgi:hypothetical protein
LNIKGVHIVYCTFGYELGAIVVRSFKILDCISMTDIDLIMRLDEQNRMRNVTASVASMGFVPGADGKRLIHRVASNVEMRDGERSAYDSKSAWEAPVGTG